MKANITNLARKWQYPLLLASGTLPLPMILGVYAMPDSPWTAALPALLYAVLALACMFISGRRRLLCGIAGALALALASLALLPWRTAPQLLLIPVIYIVLLFVTLPMAGWPAEREIGAVLGTLCLLAQIVVQLDIIICQRQNLFRYAAALTGLRINFVIYAALMLLALNRTSLVTASMAGQKPALSMRRKNTLLTFGLLALTLLIAAIPAVIEACRIAWQWFYGAVCQVLAWLMSLMPDQISAGGGGGGDSSMGLPPVEATTNPVAELLEKIFVVVAILLLIAAAIFCARYLWRKLKVLLRALWQRLTAYLAAASTDDYQDEVADTREPGELMRAFRDRIIRRNPLRGVDESKLSPAERIRFYYLRQWLKRPDWESEKTARENLNNPAAADLYDRARYSDHEITAREADDFAGRLSGR